MKENTSLLSKHLVDALRSGAGAVQDEHGNFVLAEAVKSGVENPDSSIGVYAPDADAYERLSHLFDPIIEEYHGFGPNDTHTSDLNYRSLQLEHLDPEGKFIQSTRVRVGRNLAGFPFAPGISREQRNEVERLVTESLSKLQGELAGGYYPLYNMDEETRQKLVQDHFLFKAGDRFLESAGANRDWPEGRGIYHSDNKEFLVWVNEEDQLRIISMEQGGDLMSVFARLCNAISELEKQLQFAHSERLGYLSSCPTNLGTAMRASFHIRLPNLGEKDYFHALCGDLGLSVRGIHGEHSESEGGVYDISNKRRLGISEVEAVSTLHEGTKTLIALERKLAS